MHFKEKFYYVYIMTNRSKTLYTGITSNLPKRVWQHKHGAFPGFTSRYQLDRLVYYERFAAWAMPSHAKSKCNACCASRKWPWLSL